MGENLSCSGPARTAKVLLLVFLASCWLLPTLWTVQADQPLSWDQLKHLIQQFQKGQVSEDRILYLIAERKVGFRVDKSARKVLKRLGATRLIVKAVARHAQGSLQDRTTGDDNTPPRMFPLIQSRAKMRQAGPTIPTRSRWTWTWSMSTWW